MTKGGPASIVRFVESSQFLSLGQELMSASSGITGVCSKPVIDLRLDTPELAVTYDKVSVRQFDYGKEVIRALSISAGERVLDLGAGTGHVAAYVAKIV